MNFKRNLFTIISLVGSVFAVAGCTNKNAFERYSIIQEVKDKHEEFVSDDGSYVKHGDYADYTAIIDKSGTKKNFGSFYNTFKNEAKKKIIDSTGDRKLLVVPVDFYGFTSDDLKVTLSDYFENLKKSFFGIAKNNRYVSVAEYYNRSSYGKLRITGKVCEQFYRFSIPFQTLNTYTSYTRNYVFDEYPKIVEWCKDLLGEEVLNEYRLDPSDPNSDVAMYLVYTFPADRKTGNRDFFWAYTFEERPLSWTSYSTLNTGSGKPDAHTFIHEVGHMFGLVDYYPKAGSDDDDTKKEKTETLGKIDMMDCSVGDHSAFSKMCLNWARPYHVQKSCEISIKSLINSGEIILINDNWNGSVFDEYYLIELYSPLGLNNYDSINGNNEAKLPSLPGIKIYHVDARLGYFNQDTVDGATTLKFSHYCNENFLGEKFGTVISFAHDNSTYPKATKDQLHLRNYLYELELNVIGHPTTDCASDSNLFHRSDEFEVLNFNIVNNTHYIVKVKSLTYYDATLEITKVEVTE